MYPISIRPYEDCCTVFVPKSPKTKPRLEKVEQFESQLDFKQDIEEILENVETITIAANNHHQDSMSDLL